MTCLDEKRGHRSFFIPPQILERLMRRGITTARNSVLRSGDSRTKRAEKRSALAAMAASGARASRLVYDCNHKWETRVRLAAEEGGAIAQDAAVKKTFEFLDTVRAYYRELGRNSIDGSGMDIIANVHVGEDYMNAFWDGDEMVFGDGDGELFVSFTESLDVVAHELAHGVTQHTAGLVYQSQSGALNEHMSDVFGSAIQQFHRRKDANTADWLIGDEIMGPSLFGEALRSMKAPGTAYDNDMIGRDPQPAHMRDYYSGEADHGGVHINSGIPNRAFYLSAKEMGTHEAARIWYDALLNLWPTARFSDAVDIIVESARRLVREKRAPKQSPQIVRSAFRDVGLYS